MMGGWLLWAHFLIYIKGTSISLERKEPEGCCGSGSQTHQIKIQDSQLHLNFT